jgi:hypothetical protein
MASNIVIPGSNRLQSGSDVVMQAEGRRRGGNGFTIRLVASLPALPELGVQMVLWGTSDMITDGTGDGQVWIASSNDSQWAPLYNYTDLSGDPSS